MLQLRTIEPNTLELLKGLMAEPLLANLRLVGGTSLALQYGHRSSIDIDLFGDFSCSPEELLDLLQKYGHVHVRKLAPTICLFEVNGIHVDIVRYKYPWIDNVICEDTIRMASPKDIAAMKVNAVEGRGTKKDFIDIYFLLQHYSLEQILQFYREKYPEFSIFRALLSLTYFEDADPQMMPTMFENVSWENMKSYISKQIESYK